MTGVNKLNFKALKSLKVIPNVYDGDDACGAYGR